MLSLNVFKTILDARLTIRLARSTSLFGFSTLYYLLKTLIFISRSFSIIIVSRHQIPRAPLTFLYLVYNLLIVASVTFSTLALTSLTSLLGLWHLFDGLHLASFVGD